MFRKPSEFFLFVSLTFWAPSIFALNFTEMNALFQQAQTFSLDELNSKPEEVWNCSHRGWLNNESQNYNFRFAYHTDVSGTAIVDVLTETGVAFSQNYQTLNGEMTYTYPTGEITHWRKFDDNHFIHETQLSENPVDENMYLSLSRQTPSSVQIRSVTSPGRWITTYQYCERSTSRK